MSVKVINKKKSRSYKAKGSEDYEDSAEQRLLVSLQRRNKSLRVEFETGSDKH